MMALDTTTRNSAVDCTALEQLQALQLKGWCLGLTGQSACGRPVTMGAAKQRPTCSTSTARIPWQAEALEREPS
jgi:hypothetical protein